MTPKEFKTGAQRDMEKNVLCPTLPEKILETTETYLDTFENQLGMGKF